jgi:aminoglycoside 6-adenylyltransferase
MDTLERKIMIWAAVRPEIRLVLGIGSRTHTAPRVAARADLLFHLFCTDRDGLMADPGWLESIDDVWAWLPARIDDEPPQLQVLFNGGVKVDFTFLPLSMAEGFVASGQLDEIHELGFNVLLDKDGWAARMPFPKEQSLRRDLTTERAFRSVVDDFFWGAVNVAKRIHHGDLWMAKSGDWTMKELLLQMMEWHARALHGPEYDTFSDGHLLDSWTDAQTWEELQHTYGEFSVVKSWHALFATMQVFRRLAVQTALFLGHEYPAALDKRITTLAKELHKESTQDHV